MNQHVRDPYGSRTLQVVEMAHAGMRRADIAAALGISPNAVSVMLYSARNKHMTTMHFGSPGIVRAGLPERPLAGPEGRDEYRINFGVRHETMRTLFEAAGDRGFTAATLVGRIIDTIVTDRLIDAILDDGGRP